MPTTAHSLKSVKIGKCSVYLSRAFISSFFMPPPSSSSFPSIIIRHRFREVVGEVFDWLNTFIIGFYTTLVIDDWLMDWFICSIKCALNLNIKAVLGGGRWCDILWNDDDDERRRRPGRVLNFLGGEYLYKSLSKSSTLFMGLNIWKLNWLPSCYFATFNIEFNVNFPESANFMRMA